MKSIYTVSRFVASFLILVYGFAKLNGSQFTILASELDKPMGEVSGFWLTWYYFGYSPIYGNFIALVQILGGILLMFRKTTLLGSCILLPLIVNVILVDILYRIDVGALLVAVIIAAALIIILRFHRAELLEIFWWKQNSLFPPEPSAKSRVYGKYAVRALLIAIPAIFTYWVANYNNRLPTIIDGAWDIVETTPHRESTGNALAAIFFERNRAYLCVFKRKDGSYEWHHFEINSDKRTLAVWEQWLQKGAKIFDGTYEISGNQLRLSGKFANSAAESVFVLRKRE
ncbi:MAG: hypothetical protein M3Y84_01295 [Acidobacteriota bacterium]|nr:hypothetical protein [Acidobacteriota bacterium]